MNWMRIKEVAKNTAIVTAIVLMVAAMLLNSGCGMVAGLGEDITNGADSTVKAMQSYAQSYNEANER